MQGQHLDPMFLLLPVHALLVFFQPALYGPDPVTVTASTKATYKQIKAEFLHFLSCQLKNLALQFYG